MRPSDRARLRCPADRGLGYPRRLGLVCSDRRSDRRPDRQSDWRSDGDNAVRASSFYLRAHGDRRVEDGEIWSACVV